MNRDTNTEFICTMCGKTLDEIDKEQDFHFEQWIGYGSKYDLNILEFKLCCRCFDELLDVILPLFKHNPVSEYEIVSDGDKLMGRRKDVKNGR